MRTGASPEKKSAEEDGCEKMMGRGRRNKVGAQLWLERRGVKREPTIPRRHRVGRDGALTLAMDKNVSLINNRFKVKFFLNPDEQCIRSATTGQGKVLSR